ncbi:protein rep [Phormidesmis sp. 146-20]
MNYRSAIFLSELSEREKVWSKHKKTSDILAKHYVGSPFSGYSQRIISCGESLDFQVVSEELKLSNARFCRVRHCSICQWRRSLKWKAKAYKSIPSVIHDFPTHRWLFLTLTVKNCLIEDLRSTLTWMHESFKRLTKLKTWCATGWIKSAEVTRGQDGLAHPHFHCLLMVPPSYFSGGRYLSQKKWGQLWQQSLRVDYTPVVDIRAIKKTDSPSMLVPELLKYQTKGSDLTEDREWLLELTGQLHKTRAIATGGVLCKYMRDSKKESEDLESDKSDDASQSSLRFRWNSGARQYNLES